MKLSELQTGEKAVIAKVNGHGSFRKRLIEMGFIQGKEVTVILNAPLKDPIEYEIIGYKISLRREEAEQIEVVNEAEAREALVSDEHLQGLPEDMADRERLDKALAHLAEERHRVIRVALVGNPNCGKTSLFNIASGAHEHVGNYSGVTVDAKEGHFKHGGYDITLVDLPGTYSLSAYSPEELYVRKNLIDAMPDVVVNVVDASNIERNLYLTTQVIDMNLRTVMALNMYDELQHKGDKLDTEQLGKLLGMPVCPTVSRDGQGIPELFDTVIKVYEHTDPQIARHIHINHGKEIEKSIVRLRDLIFANKDIRYRYSTRYLSIKYLEGDRDIETFIAKLPNHEALAAARAEETERIESLLQTTPEAAIVDAKYAFIQGALAETYEKYQEERPRRTITDRIDAIVTNKWLAFPIFILLLWFTFWATFTIGQYPMDWIDWLVGKFGDFVGAFMKEGWLKDLIVDGIIAGCGSVLVFLPNIMILYLFISLMEDSGYMARAAFIVDKLMHRIGLHGKSFIPMVMGFGCNVHSHGDGLRLQRPGHHGYPQHREPEIPPHHHRHHPVHVLRGPAADFRLVRGRFLPAQCGDGAPGHLLTGCRACHPERQGAGALRQGRRPSFRDGTPAVPRPYRQSHLAPYLGEGPAVSGEDGYGHPPVLHRHLVPGLLPAERGTGCRLPAGALLYRHARKNGRAGAGTPRIQLEDGCGPARGRGRQGTGSQHPGRDVRRR